VGQPAVGTIVLVPFPFADLSRLKKRPALVIAHAEFGNVIVCQITSRQHTSKTALSLADADFIAGGLPVVSFIRPDKLSTLESGLVISELGVLTDQKLDEIKTTVRELFA
jgi:mRNA interferase MazF